VANNPLAQAAHEFEDALSDLGIDGDEAEFDPRLLGRRAALLAAADLVWHKRLGRLLERQEVEQILGIKTSNRQAVHDYVRRGRLLALRSEHGQRLQYPAFQFDVERGRIFPEVRLVLHAFAGAVETPLTIASWFVEPQALLDERSPSEWMHERRDPDRLVAAAEASASALAH
jgi:hypothetical protein